MSGGEVCAHGYRLSWRLAREAVELARSVREAWAVPRAESQRQAVEAVARAHGLRRDGQLELVL